MRHRAILLAALLAAIGIAGCVDDGPENVATEVGDDTEPTEAIPTFGPHSGLPRDIDLVPDRTWEEPPQWILGEWWEIELTSGFTGETSTFTRVVAGKEGENYLVGMPLESFNDEAMIMHFPGFGLIQSNTLGYEAHDFMFEPLSFPLEVDTTWQSLWQGANAVLTHLVADRDDENGLVYLEAGGAQTITYTYDVEMGQIVEFNAPGYASYRVIDHGYDYEGMVRVPHGHDLTFFHGRLGPAVGVAQSEGVQVPNTNLLVSPNPIETITISEDYDRASFILAAFDLAPLLLNANLPVSTGVNSITATAPDGTSYDLTTLPTQAGHSIVSFAHDLPAGEWTLQTVAAGAMQVFMEGVSYVVFDVDLPSGCVQLTERVHDHGGDCGGHVHDIE